MRQAPRLLLSFKQLSIGMLALTLAGCLNIADPRVGLSLITIIGGNNQTVAVNATATDPLTIRAFDETTSPMPGVVVIWSITNGAGTLGSTSTTTDATGTTSVTFKAGASAGTVNIKATSSDLNVTFTEVVQ